MRQFFKGFPTNYATISSNGYPEPSTWLVLVVDDDGTKKVFQVDKEEGIDTSNGWVKIEALTYPDTPSTYSYDGKEIPSDSIKNHYTVSDMTDAILAIIEYNEKNSSSQYFSHILSFNEFKRIEELSQDNEELVAAINDFMF